jgi:hypothetical protein
MTETSPIETVRDDILSRGPVAFSGDVTLPRRYPDMSRADVRDTLWIALREAHRSAHNLSRGQASASQLARLRGYRDGLLDAYAMLTGNDPETIHEDLQAGLGD